VGNKPVRYYDPLGLWTLGFGVQGSAAFLASAGVSFGFYIGYSDGNGWSFGFLGSASGGMGLPSASAGIFVQATNAKCVDQLKGKGFAGGASGGEGISVGADVVSGEGYKGIQVNGGAGGGFPVEFHGEVSGTGGATF